MSNHRWFQLSLKSLFLLTLVVAAFFAGYAFATKRADKAIRAEQEARMRAEEAAQEAAREARRAEEAAKAQWGPWGYDLPIDS